jgi:hypothetical protein
LIFEMAAAAEQMLKKPRKAFEWYRRAYHEEPDDTTLGRLEDTAETYSLWEDLISVYLGDGARSTEARDQVEVARKVAGLCEERSNDWAAIPPTGRACWMSMPRWRADGPTPKRESRSCASGPRCAKRT